MKLTGGGTVMTIAFLAVVGDVPQAIAQSCVQPPSGLVGWWPGDGDAQDIQGSNHGLLQNGVTFVAGHVDQAFHFDGTGHVRIPNTPELEPPQITVDAWILPTFAGRPARTADADTIIEKVQSGPLVGYGLYVTMDPQGGFFERPAVLALGTPAFFLNVSGVLNQIFSPFALPDDGSFHHLAGTFDGSTMRLYVDGVEVASRNIAGAITHAQNADTIIGSEPLFGPRPSLGTIDEVELFSRALIASEIKAVFDAGTAGKCKGGVVEVSIDVKPGSYPNCFNVNGNGVIPVAILGASNFDVNDVDTSSLLFDGLEVRVRGNKGPMCHVEDSSGDGINDLVCQFEDNPENWMGGGTEGTVSGNLLDGTPFEGTDSICIVR